MGSAHTMTSPAAPPSDTGGSGRSATIGQAADASGVSAKLIRYYESIGLVPAAVRTESGYRMYAAAGVQTLRFIKRARTLGFSVEQIRHLLALWHNRSRASAEVRTLALKHVAELEEKIHALHEMVETLRGLADHCHNDEHPECPILAELDRPERSDGSKTLAGPAAVPGLPVTGAVGQRPSGRAGQAPGLNKAAGVVTASPHS